MELPFLEYAIEPSLKGVYPLIDLKAVLFPEPFPPSMATVSPDEVQESVPAVKTKPQMFGSFHLGDCEFALPSDNIKQVVELPKNWVNLPQSPDFVQGAFDLRGTLITVVDLNLLFGLSETTSRC